MTALDKAIKASRSGGRTKLARPLPGRNLNVQSNVQMAIHLVDVAQRWYTNGRDFWHSHFAYTVTISESDSLYSDVYDWLIATLPDEKHRSLSISSSRNTTMSTSSWEDEEESMPGSTAENKAIPLKVRFDDRAKRTVMLDGNSISVAMSKPDAPEAGSNSNFREPVYSSIVFTAKTHEGQQAIVRQLETLNAKRATTRKAVLKMINQWGSWNTRSDLPPRTMASVALPEEQKDRITEDLKRFLEAEDKYNRLAIPWHRGYMLYGPPGTGKTSLVKALANEFNLDLWYVSLSDLKEESSLLSLLASVGPRSILLLEDIDTMRITHDRDGAEQGKISMSSLLNTLDGVATPHGLITMMTTNRFDIIDPALKRPGRMDLVEHLSYPTLNTLSKMYEHFFEKTPDWSKLGDPDKELEGISTGEIAEILKRHMDDADAASVAVAEKLKTL